MVCFQNQVAVLSVTDKQSILSYWFSQPINPLIFFPIYKNNRNKKSMHLQWKNMTEIKSQLWVKVINKKMIPTDICICSESFFPHVFPTELLTVLLKHNKIHENDIRNFLVRDETTEEIREFLFVSSSF